MQQFILKMDYSPDGAFNQDRFKRTLDQCAYAVYIFFKKKSRFRNQNRKSSTSNHYLQEGKSVFEFHKLIKYVGN
jgi:hypothetical protein